MRAIVNTSGAILLTALLGAAVVGCDRNAPDQTAGSVGASAGGNATTPDSSGASGATGSSSSVGAAIDDSVITTKVKTALLADSDIKGSDINVETKKGEVMLSGFVGSQAQIDRALKVANAIDGVRSVNNKMAVRQ